MVIFERSKISLLAKSLEIIIKSKSLSACIFPVIAEPKMAIESTFNPLSLRDCFRNFIIWFIVLLSMIVFLWSIVKYHLFALLNRRLTVLLNLRGTWWGQIFY